MQQRLIPQIPINDCRKIYTEVVKIGKILNQQYQMEYVTKLNLHPIINIDQYGTPNIDINLLLKLPATQELSQKNILEKTPKLHEDYSIVSACMVDIKEEINKLSKKYSVKPNIIWAKVYDLILDQI